LRSLLHRASYTLFTGSAFLLFFTGGVILSYLILPLARLRPGTPGEKARRCRRIVGASWRFFHAYMRWTRLIWYHPRETALALPEGPFVLVANHPTLVDVTALVCTHPDLAIVAKTSMFRSPLVGRLLRACDHIQGGDGSAFSGAAVVDQALDHLRAGTPVLVFPEGTRSPERGLGKMQLGAFQIAARAGVPIVPALITCEPPTLMRGQAWYAIPKTLARMKITQLPTLPPPHDVRARADELRGRWLEHLAGGAAPGAAVPTERPGLAAP